MSFDFSTFHWWLLVSFPSPLNNLKIMKIDITLRSVKFAIMHSLSLLYPTLARRWRSSIIKSFPVGLNMQWLRTLVSKQPSRHFPHFLKLTYQLRFCLNYRRTFLLPRDGTSKPLNYLNVYWPPSWLDCLKAFSVTFFSTCPIFSSVSFRFSVAEPKSARQIYFHAYSGCSLHSHYV